MKFREIILILEENGFEKIRTKSSHRRYKGYIGGQARHVTVAFKRLNDDILPKTLAAMIRQSGLPKKLFRK
ncbi:MAG: type II toxin-antitoxin system HicA family toxin [Proteobacteria bacterium]|nr:type II toxin-antitoxin system HicA family toxin [Pseudomonadota bacterium]